MEINGAVVDRQVMRDWLQSKRITLWGDWLIGKEKDQDDAIDWFLGQVVKLSEFARPTDGPDPDPISVNPNDGPGPTELHALAEPNRVLAAA